MEEPYTLVDGTPDVAAYRRLRSESGLSPKTEEQASRALAGTWWGCHVVHAPSGEVVAMGRVIGDGGWYVHVADMATLPAHQRRGLGDRVLTALLDRIGAQAPPDAYVSLFADPPGRRLYERHGFRDSSDRSVGMTRWLGRPTTRNGTK